MTKLALTGVLLGLITACGDNGNDVGFFHDESSGGTDPIGDTTDASSANTTTAASDGTGGGESSAGTDATTDGSGATTDASASMGGTGAASGSTDGMGGIDGTSGEETTSGGSGGATSGETGGVGGTLATGGGSSGGSGGGNSETCPDERPTGNTECDAVGVCDYGEGCTQDLMACEEGLWIEVVPEPHATCEDFGPGSYPQNGQSCECLGDLRCQFLDCDGRGNIRASCVEGSWQVQDADCVNRPCAANPEGEDVPMCEPGEICVAVSAGGPAITYECEPNPCADARLQTSCECARSLCPESDAIRCEIQEEATVVACICDECN